ncbi:MAG: polymerase, sigma-24 subunit, subfamily [Chitinophagaceae bacterium]|nr:polymerase, sigma-24 subunit, subfamily [Chitinophagaceae bacterium]
MISKDKKGFDILYNNYSSSLYGVIHLIVKKEEYSEEILQDTFLKIWKKIDDYDASKGRFFTWMLNIARNMAIDKLRSKEFKAGNKTDDISSYVDIGDTGYADKHNMDHIGVKDVLNKLPEEHRFLIQKMYFEGYSQSEIAEEFDIPLGTVKTRVRTAMSKLRELFQ